jgi:Zn-dependent protease/predicted transcriptional regulator
MKVSELRSQIKLGHISGIEIGLHYSWLIIALLISFSLAGHFHSVRPDWSGGLTWVVAILTSIFFFVTLLLHELAHSIVAKSHGLRVRAITLFALGGVSQIESEASDAKSEFWIAVVGPLTSLVIGALLIGIARLSGAGAGEASGPVGAVLLWLGYINLALAGFNMIPGYPLDGGRVLRAIAWWITHNADRATRIASQVGQVVAFLFILYGVFRFFVGANFGGLWMAFIGWFLLDAARSSYVQVSIAAGLRDRHVADIMERDCPAVPGYLSIRDFVDEHVLHTRNGCFIVMQDMQAVGLITANEAKKVSRDRWEQTSVQSVMRPLKSLPSVAPEMPVLKAMELMTREHVSELAVVSNGHFEGIFSRMQVLHFLHVYSGLGPPNQMAA